MAAERCSCGKQATCYPALAHGKAYCPQCHRCNCCKALSLIPPPAPVIVIGGPGSHVEHCARKGPFAYIFRDDLRVSRVHKRGDGVWQQELCKSDKPYSRYRTVDNHPKCT